MVAAKSLPDLERFGMNVPDGETARDPGETGRRPLPVWVPIRTLQPRDRARILDHLLQLDERDRYLRFGFHVTAELLKRYVAAIDFKRDEVFGVFNRRLKLVAVAHLASLPPGASPAGPGVAAMEFGVSVLGQARGRGLGQLLFEHAMVHARNHGARAMVIHALTENRPMLRIAVRAGATLQTDGPDAEAWLALPEDTFGSRIEGSLLAWGAELVYGVKRRMLKLRGRLPR